MLPPEVRVVELSSDDAWMRDVGPTFVVDGRGGRRAVDWPFNAWGGLRGGLYFPWDRDDQVAQKVAEVEGADRYRAPLVLEGGSIHVDGEGTCLTTEECLLNPNRNPQLAREEVEATCATTSASSASCGSGAASCEDETDGHVDNLACFTAPGVVALTWTDDRDDPQHAVSADARARLEAAPGSRSHLLHQPGPLVLTEDEARGVDPVAGTQAAPGRRPPRRAPT